MLLSNRREMLWPVPNHPHCAVEKLEEACSACVRYYELLMLSRCSMANFFEYSNKEAPCTRSFLENIRQM